MPFTKTIPLLLIFSLVSCGGGGGSSDISTSTPTPPPSTEITESCVQYGNNTKKCTLTHKALERYYIIYVPESGASEASMPILFALHGYGSTAETHKNYTNYQPLSETHTTKNSGKEYKKSCKRAPKEQTESRSESR